MRGIYAKPRDALVAVLAALAKLDPQKEGVGRIRIWKFSPHAKSATPYGWSISIVREVSNENSAPPAAYNWTGPAPRGQRECEADRLRWHELALTAYEECLAEDMQAAEEAAE